MKLKVKQGREYVLGGKVYRSGDIVDIPDKHAKVLTLPKMPLEHMDMAGPTDLPPAAAITPAAERPPQGASRRRYQRRDMRAESGQTGAETPSLSSPPAPQPSEPISEASGDESAS